MSGPRPPTPALESDGDDSLLAGIDLSALPDYPPRRFDFEEAWDFFETTIEILEGAGIVPDYDFGRFFTSLYRQRPAPTPVATSSLLAPSAEATRSPSPSTPPAVLYRTEAAVSMPTAVPLQPNQVTGSALTNLPNLQTTSAQPAHASSQSITPATYRRADPNRFAPEAPRPYQISLPPPPADKLLQHDWTARVNSDDGYGQSLRGRPPVNVQPPLGIQISMGEIMTFCPSWMQIPDVAIRAACNGYVRDDLARMLLYPAGLLDETNDRPTFIQASARIQAQISQGGKIALGYHPKDSKLRWNAADTSRVLGPQNDLTADDWELRCDHRQHEKKQRFTHMRLSDIYATVPRNSWPSGSDRLLFTMCLEYAHANPHLNLDTSHFAWIIEARALTAPQVHGGSYDAAALLLFRNTVAGF